MKQYHIQTTGESAILHFFTRAKNNKKALKNLLDNSWDFKNVLNGKGDLIITVKKV